MADIRNIIPGSFNNFLNYTGGFIIRYKKGTAIRYKKGSSIKYNHYFFGNFFQKRPSIRYNGKTIEKTIIVYVCETLFKARGIFLNVLLSKRQRSLTVTRLSLALYMTITY